MIVIEDLHKSFGTKKVLDGINMTIETGSTVAIIGRSGCGKSVLIKHIIGLLFPDSGKVTVDNLVVNELKEKDIYLLRQKFGFLFQSAALFDSLTVEENVGLALVENSKLSKKDITKIVDEKLDVVNLKNINSLKPAELSGGMKKRVGLARALVTNPEYILYDEPTTGLDPITSDNIDKLVKDLSERIKVTSIVVTHDMVTVKNIADKIFMLHDGKVYFDGRYEKLLETNDDVINNFIQRSGF